MTPDRANALLGAGTLAWAQGDYPRAGEHLDESLRAFASLGDERGRGWTLLARGRLDWDAGETGPARERFEAALAIFRPAGVGYGTAMCLHGLGLVAHQAGDFPAAIRHFERASSEWTDLGYAWGLACCLPGHLGDIAWDRGEIGRAETLYRQSLALNWEHRDRENISWNFIGLARTHLAGGRADVAARLLGASAAVREGMDAPLRRDERAAFDAVVTETRASLGDGAFDAATWAGRSLSLADAVASQLDLPIGRDGAMPTGRAHGGLDTAARTTAESTAAPAAGAPIGTANPGGDQLTTRERDVLRLVVVGWTDKEIADDLFISPRTVQSHMVRLFRKLGVRTRAAAAAIAVRQGLV